MKRNLIACLSVVAAAASVQACSKAKPPALLDIYRDMVGQVGYTGVLPQDLASMDVAHILFENGQSRGDPIWAYCTDVQGPTPEEIIASGGAATFSTNHHEVMTWDIGIDGTPQQLTNMIPELSVNLSGTDMIKVTMKVEDTEIRVAKDAALGVYLTDFEQICRKGLAPFNYVVRVMLGTVVFDFKYIDETKGSVELGWKGGEVTTTAGTTKTNMIPGLSASGLWRVGSDGKLSSTRKLVLGYISAPYTPR